MLENKVSRGNTVPLTRRSGFGFTVAPCGSRGSQSLVPCCRRAMALLKLSWSIPAQSALKSGSDANPVQNVTCRTWASGHDHLMMNYLAIPALCSTGSIEEFQHVKANKTILKILIC